MTMYECRQMIDGLLRSGYRPDEVHSYLTVQFSLDEYQSEDLAVIINRQIIERFE